MNVLCPAVRKFATISTLILSAFASQAQTPDTNWSIAVLDQILASVQPGQNLAQVGDMQIRVSNLQTWRNQLAGEPIPQLAFDGTAPTWPGGNVYYTFDSSVTPAHQKAYLDGANEWATFANLHFILQTTQANYVTIQEQAFLEGGQSSVGMVGGQQFLSIGPSAWNRPTICHETGHTLGLIHEHQRSDRNSFVTILTNNIQSGEEGNFVLLTDSRNQTPYDFLSIMHYNRTNLSVSPLVDTIEPLAPYTKYLNIMGLQFDPVLSASDRAGMAAIYGAGPPQSSVVTNTQDSGPGSLRAAMYYAFDHPGTTITFNIPTNDPGYTNHVFTIQPTDAFPSMVNAMTIDGSTQTNNPNGPAVQLNGTLAPPPSVFPNGLRLAGTNCSVRALVVNGFIASGILIDGTNATGNTVKGCYLGIDPTGTLEVPNGFTPITIDSGASGNTVGGTNAAARNILSGSAFQGLVIRDPGTRSNLVIGNYIGLTATGNAPLPNAAAGIGIFNGAQSNTVGGTASSMRNIISGNGKQGVVMADTNTSGNVIIGNYVGLSTNGTVAIPNGWSAVECFGGASANTIGGTAPGAGNVLSGNTGQGIVCQDPGTFNNLIQGNLIGLNPAGTAVIPNGGTGIDIYNGPQGTMIGGNSPGAGNVISGNQNPGVYLHASGTIGNVIQGNYIGVNAAGNAAVSNKYAGVQISEGAQFNLVGGTSVSMRNIISGNGLQGVLIGTTGTTGNLVQGNYIGLNAAGSAAIPNGDAGVLLGGGSQANLVGGTSPGAGNIVSGNLHDGVLLADPGTSGNWVYGNFIGTDPNGTTGISNHWSGVEIYNGPGTNVIGGSAVGAGNLISGNGNYGVLMQFGTSSGNFLQGNYIGVNAVGNAALPNTFAGVGLRNGVQSNLIGGNTPGTGNVISGNLGQGMEVADSATAFNVIQGNLIGLDATGTTALPNQGFAGIDIFNSASANIIGGGIGARNMISGNAQNGISLTGNAAGHLIQGNTVGLNAAGTGPVPNGAAGIIMFTGAVGNQVGGTFPGAANFIDNNPGGGLQLYDAATTNNSIRGNSIFGNAGSSITLNTSANHSQATPSLTSAVLGTNTTVSGTVTSAANTTYHVDFYASPPPASPAQAQTYIGSKDVTTSAGGSVSFSLGLGALIPAAQIITATATDPSGNTSGLSSGVPVTTTDSVGDGIPNTWRTAHFGGSGTTTNSQSCATCDPDHDGMNNLQEFLAGTDPTNSASALRIASLNRANQDVILKFQSGNGIVYRLLSRTNLATAGWSVVADEILGTGSLMQLTNPGVAVLPRQFYRISAEP